jgi:hypothetical protein
MDCLYDRLAVGVVRKNFSLSAPGFTGIKEAFFHQRDGMVDNPECKYRFDGKNQATAWICTVNYPFPWLR